MKRRKEKSAQAEKVALDRQAEEFLLYLEAEKNASPRTVSTYRIALEAFRKFHPEGAWTAMRAEDFRAWMLDMMKAFIMSSIQARKSSARIAVHAPSG